MKRPFQIGITGGIGSGKSLVSRIFKCLGIPVYDSDSRAKNLMTTDGILMKQIQKEFGSLSYFADGTLNRKYVSDVVFTDEGKLKKLNQLVHPRVSVDYSAWLVENVTKPYVLKEAALLFETESNKNLDKVIVVTAPEEIRIERVLARDTHRTREMVKAIIKNQMPEVEKIEKADYLVYNDESRLVLPQIMELHQRFISGEL